MNELHDHQLVQWLSAGPERGPEHGLGRALAATRRVPQRHRLPSPVRWIGGAATGSGPGSRPAAPGIILRFAFVLAAVAVSVAVGLGLVARPGQIGGPPPSAAVPSASAAPPSASPSPSATIEPSPGYGSAPPDWLTPAPLAPATPLPAPTGAVLPDTLLGRSYNVDPPVTQGTQALVLTLRAADDPHCMAMYAGGSTCFTILWTPNYPRHTSDPGVRGPARIIDGNLVLGFALVPNDPGCEGTSSTYAISPDGWTLRGTDVPACSFQGFTRH